MFLLLKVTQLSRLVRISGGVWLIIDYGLFIAKTVIN